VSWSTRFVTIVNVCKDDDAFSRKEKERRNKETMRVAQLEPTIARESCISLAVWVCRKLFTKSWFHKETHCAMILFVMMKCNNQAMPFSVFDDWEKGLMMDGENNEKNNTSSVKKCMCTMKNNRSNTNLVKKFYWHSICKHHGPDGGLGVRCQPFGGDWTTNNWWKDDEVMESTIKTLNEHMCISRLGVVDSSTIHNNLEAEIGGFKHQAKITYFQFMALMGWLGSKAVIVGGLTSEETTTIGGMCHGTSADGVGPAGIKRMNEAGVTDSSKQAKLFEKISFKLGLFPSYTEQSFCEQFRERPAYDTFVHGESLCRLMWEKDENVALSGRMVLLLMEKRFGCSEWERCSNNEFDCIVWLKDLFNKVKTMNENEDN